MTLVYTKSHNSGFNNYSVMPLFQHRKKQKRVGVCSGDALVIKRDCLSGEVIMLRVGDQGSIYDWDIQNTFKLRVVAFLLGLLRVYGYRALV